MSAGLRSIEEWIDSRRFHPTLESAAERLLPPGMTLLTPRPRRSVMRGLVRRVFVLGFECSDNRVITHTEEHCDEIPEDAQLRWAISRFEEHLKAAELV